LFNQIGVHYLLGLLIPVSIICWLKRKGHDNGSFYFAEMLPQEGLEEFEKTNSHLLKVVNNLRDAQLKYKKADFLGRSNL
jgi:hypothetical protein